jgi:hypothetical protein
MSIALRKDNLNLSAADSAKHLIFNSIFISAVLWAGVQQLHLRFVASRGDVAIVTAVSVKHLAHSREPIVEKCMGHKVGIWLCADTEWARQLASARF